MAYVAKKIMATYAIFFGNNFMLSYQHAFHAGNHADVLKHLTLIYVLNSLNKKEKPYTCFDSHAGSGIYNLEDSRILKTLEAEKGIIKLFSELNSEDFLFAVRKNEALCNYLDYIRPYLEKNFYPGSPEIEKKLKRNQDFLFLSELHPKEFENLKVNMKKDFFSKDNPLLCKSKVNDSFSNISIHKRSGWEMIEALTPPKTSRGSLLVDPSYEEDSDYIHATQSICRVYKKWSNGIIMLWYPLLLHRKTEIEKMLTAISSFCQKQNSNVELCNLQLKVFEPDESKPRLYGSGMFVINPPYLLEQNVNEALAVVKKVL